MANYNTGGGILSYSLELSIESKDLARAKKALEGFNGTVEELENKLKALGIATKGLKGIGVTLDINSRVDGQVQVSNLTTETTKLAKANKVLTEEQKKRLRIDDKSVLSSRQRLSQAKQELSAMAPLSDAFKEQSARVAELTVELRRANGVAPTSVAEFQAIGKELEEMKNKTSLSEKELKEFNVAIAANSQQLRRAQGIQQGSVTELSALQNEQRSLASTLRVGSKEQKRAADAVAIYGRKIDRASGKTTSFISVLGKLSTIQSGLIAISSVFNAITGSINKVVGRTKALQSFDLALRNIGLSAAQAAVSFNQASATASQLGAPVEQVEKAYKRIVPALDAIGTSSKNTDKFIAALSARTQVLGLTTEESGRLQEAFAQVLAKGKLQAEELTQQISEVDGAFRTQFANALGVSIAKLEDLVSTGQITGTVFVDTILKMNNGVDLLSSNIENGTATIQQLQNEISNISTKTLESIGQALEPGIRAFLEAGRVFAKFVQDVANSPIGRTLANVFNGIAKSVEVVVKFFDKLARAIGAVLSPLAPLLELLGNFAGPLVVIGTTLAIVNIALGKTKDLFRRITIEAKSGSKAMRNYRSSLINVRRALRDIKRGNFANSFRNLTRSVNDFGRGTGRGLFGNLLDGFDLLKGKSKVAGKAVKTAGSTAAKAGTKSAVAAKGVGSLGVKYGATAVAAKAGGAAILAAGALITGVVLAITAAVAAGGIALNGYFKAISDADKPIKNASKELKSLGFEAAGAKNGFEQLADYVFGPFITIFKAAKKVIDDFVDVLFTFGQDRAFEDQMRRNSEQVDAISKKLRGDGVKGLLDYENAQKLSGKASKDFIRGINVVKNSVDAQIGSLDKQIKKLEEEGKQETRNYKSKVRMKEALTNQSAALEIASRRLSIQTEEARKNLEVEKDSATFIEKSAQALQKKNEQLDAAASKLQTEGQDEFNKGLITEAELTLQNAAVNNAVADQKIKNIDAEIVKIKQRKAANSKDLLAQQDGIIELGRKRIEAANAAELAETELRAAQKARIQEAIQDNESLRSTYSSLAGQLKGTFSDLDSALSDGLSTFSKEFQKITELEFIATGDFSVLQDAVKIEKEVLLIQQRIDTAKRKIAQAERAHKLEMLAIETQIKIAELEASPRTAAQEKLLDLYKRQLGFIGQQQNLAKVTSQIEDTTAKIKMNSERKALNFRTKFAKIKPLPLIDGDSVKTSVSEFEGQIKKAAPALEKVASQMQGVFSDSVRVGRDGINQVNSIGRASTAQIEGGLNAVQEGVDKLKDEEDKITMNNFGLDPAQLKAEIGETANSAENAFKRMASASDIFKGALGEVGGAFVELGTKATGSYAAIDNTLKLVQSLSGLVNGVPDFNKRATGGPVEAGKTYTVNDGGGRESFMDRAGNLSLLPASRNMKWKAPKTGMVLPASVTEKIIERDKIGQKLNKSGSSAKPAVSRVSVDGMASSGTLIKQMGAMMKGGDTQRITNNVTIQSQSPVMDASEILVNVSKLRARRGIR